MYVYMGKGKSYERVQIKCEFRLNGSFVDIFFNQGDEQKWIAIEINGLWNFLKNQNKKCFGIISYDVPADFETLVNEFIEDKINFDKSGK